MTRRAMLVGLAASLARAAARLPANRNVRWAVSANLWRSFPDIPFTGILDVMRDTGFIGIRMTQFPRILVTYNITVPQMDRELSRRGLHVITVSFDGPAHDPARRSEFMASARQAMEFLSNFGANRLVVFSPARSNAALPGAFQSMCECYNQLGTLARGMGFRAGLHNHLGQMVQTSDEVERCMSMTRPELFGFAPDTAHLYLAGADVGETIGKYRDRLVMLDYKDARRVSSRFLDNIFDLGDGDIDFPACHRILKSVSYKGWVCVDLDTARQGPRVSYERCGAYVVNRLEPVYA
jgi:sugar phosphate isomerase/epimerase